MFAHFSLPDVPDVARRTVSSVLVAALAALVAGFAFDKALVGVGACVGLALGTLNFRMIGNSVAKVSASEDENKRRPLAINTLGRLGIITAITIGLLFASKSVGFGALFGLLAFQVILLANVARSMAKAGPMTSVDDVINANVVEDGVRPAQARPALDTPDDTPGGG